ncbi:hypothetical protein GCU67_20775 [Modestobacter muralis]|uniref:Colicin import membrane protein n=1 Tax=Modestobacter muralis TaxID=1608614 RepID=A0A6P0F075_9ACTN|nr:hypothetical protein [Modestobacter muralis]NEK96580.1 hypothetical protein [Modestobacter muralis]NEN53499.1 hypothetical protein [Modestobacter muralis]
MSEPDGADEIVGGGLRLAATAAALVGQRIAEARAEAARQAAEADAQQARQMGTRLTAERNAARAQYGVVDRDDWWRTAGASDVADVWQTAQSWRDLDPEANRALDRIRTQVRDRYGVDLDDGGEVDRDALERAVTERQAAAVERRRAQQAGETLEAAVALATNEPNVAAVLDQNVRRAGLATELAELEKPIDLAAQVVAGLRQGGERDVTVAQAEVNRATAAAGSYESAEARLLAEAAQGGGAVGTEESARRAQLTQAMGTTAPAARTTADQLNAKPVTAAPAAGKAALRAPKARKSPDRTAERSRGR